MSQKINLIGINGRIGAGKDTVGNLIRAMTCGKEYVDWMSIKPGLVAYDERKAKWEIKKFAHKLKLVAGIMLGVDPLKFEDQEYKKTMLGKDWDIDGIPMSVREFLQKLGTEGIRNGVHTNAWVNSLFAEFIPTMEDDKVVIPQWIITDCRFPNEAQAIKDNGGIVIRVERETDVISDHPSETGLDSWDFDYVIMNNFDLEELQYKVKEFLKEYNLI